MGRIRARESPPKGPGNGTGGRAGRGGEEGKGKLRRKGRDS